MLPMHCTVQVQDAVGSLLGYKPDSVSSTIRSGRVGGYMGYQWTVTWPWDKGNDVPQVLLSPGPNTPPGHLVVSAITSNASTPITGQLEVSCLVWLGVRDACTLPGSVFTSPTLNLCCTLATSLGTQISLSSCSCTLLD